MSRARYREGFIGLGFSGGQTPETANRADPPRDTPPATPSRTPRSGPTQRVFSAETFKARNRCKEGVGEGV